MRVVSIFTARELNLTEDEEQFLIEKCEGSPSCCFAPFMVLKNEEISKIGMRKALNVVSIRH